MTHYTVLPDLRSLVTAAADRFVSSAVRAIDEHGMFRVALSGGSTPKLVYPLLLEPVRRDAVDWSHVEFFWGDERSVPPDHPESNFGVAYQMLIAHLPDVEARHIHRMPAEAADLDTAALSYESELRLAFGVRGSRPPPFDLIWLGMGPDGHTASLFPGSEALAERDRWVVGNWAPSQATWRMTMTFPVLNAGREIIFVIAGADKVEAMSRVRAGASGLPAAAVDGDRVEWIIEADAAGPDSA